MKMARKWCCDHIELKKCSTTIMTFRSSFFASSPPVVHPLPLSRLFQRGSEASGHCWPCYYAWLGAQRSRHRERETWVQGAASRLRWSCWHNSMSRNPEEVSFVLLGIDGDWTWAARISPKRRVIAGLQRLQALCMVTKAIESSSDRIDTARPHVQVEARHPAIPAA